MTAAPAAGPAHAAAGAGLGSFRQLLLMAFLLIALLLGGTALRAVVILDRLMAQSADEAARSLELSAAAQSLAAHVTAMERAARQSLILNDRVLRGRADEEARGAQAALDRLGASGLAPGQIGPWRARLAGITGQLDGPWDTALARERELALAFRELDLARGALNGQVQLQIERRNQALQATLDDSRARLTRQVMLAIALALGLAIGFGLWLARPFQQLEQAIVALGQSSVTQPIAIRGPADVRSVGRHLEWLRVRLDELEGDRSRFLRHVSHELKTPLAALREGVALLEEGVTGELTAGQREVARILHQNTLNLQRQIEALLRFNAAAFEARQLRRRPTVLRTLVQQQVQLQRLQWQAQGLDVRVEGQAGTLLADPDKLGAAVANLLSNAIRFSPHGGTIRITLAHAAGRAVIAVADQGPGVPENERARVFDPFFRGTRQPEGAVPGSGIGLSIVRETVAAHGGTVALSSDGAGAVFRIELPHADA